MRKFLIVAGLLALACLALACNTPTMTTSPVSTPTLTELPQARVTEQPGAVFVPDVYHCACECIPTPTPTPEPVITPTVTIYDCQGDITNTLWLTSTFGDVRWSEGSLAELRCSIGPAVLVAHVQDAEGKPVENATVVLWYSTGPFLPPELQWCSLDRGAFGPTNENGDIGFGLGGGSYYFPPAGGPHVMWMVGGESCLSGLGMLGGTNHQHLDSGWILSGAAVVDSDWGFSTGAVLYQMIIGGREMWVIRVP